LFRGEKLYVNKANTDRRIWKKVICWTFTLLLLAGAVTVAVLIGGIYKENKNKLRLILYKYNDKKLLL